MSSMLIKWLRLTQELKENPGCYNNRGFYFPPQSRMLTKSWDEENAPAAMMMRELSGRHLFKFIRFQMIADTQPTPNPSQIQKGASSALTSRRTSHT
jgi:hypothetical protein